MLTSLLVGTTALMMTATPPEYQRYIYSYEYSPNEAWVDDINDPSVSEEAMKKSASEFVTREDVAQEIEKTIETVNEKRQDGDLVYTLLTDTHYVVGGVYWYDTAKCIEAVNEKISPDGIIHMGDFSDGMLSKEICQDYSHRVIDRLKEQNIPLYVTTGNHDWNYFRGNPEILNSDEMYEMYLNGVIPEDALKNVPENENGEKALYYYVDIEDKNLRILFLDAYRNDEENRYGYTLEEVDWVKARVSEVSKDAKILVVSHDTLVTGQDYWAAEIRNGDKLIDVLENADANVIGFLHGHTHADTIYRSLSFPVISTTSSKLEYFQGKDPEGSFRPVREEGNINEVAFDTLLIHQDGSLDLVRFGAGLDRSTNQKMPKVWAHRGASGYAPENTMEAFELALDMGVDGIELDVQLTRDRELVVIHDETIDRESDGSGYVADLSLEELREFNYNKTHPEYCEHADIPTLREVLDLIAPTDVTLNIELKTSVNPYPGIEQAVNDLVHEYDEYNLSDRIIYSSFNHDSIMRMKAIDENARLGLLCASAEITDFAGYAKDNGCEAIHTTLQDIKREGFVDSCQANDTKLNIWTIDSVGDMRACANLQVNSVITNYPDVAMRELQGKEVDIEALLASHSENIVVADEEEQITEVGPNPNPLFHAMGVIYGKVRQVFIKIDKILIGLTGR